MTPSWQPAEALITPVQQPWAAYFRERLELSLLPVLAAALLDDICCKLKTPAIPLAVSVEAATHLIPSVLGQAVSQLQTHTRDETVVSSDFPLTTPMLALLLQY